MKHTKSISLIVLVLLGLVAFTGLVSADTDLYEITIVKADGITVYNVDNGGNIAVSGIELDGDELSVTLYVEGTGIEYDATTDEYVLIDECERADDEDTCSIEVRAKAWIGGYSNGDIEATSDEFDIEPGVTESITLTLDLPEELLDEDDGDNEYTLYVEVYDSEEEERVTADLHIQEPNDALYIYDVNYNSNVDAGEVLDLEVRVENLGENKQEDIEVCADITELDLNTCGYMDELAGSEEDNEDEEDSDSEFLSLQIPSDTTSGTYEVTVTVTYDRGHEETTETFDITVDGVETDEEDEDTSEADVTVSLSSTNLNGLAEEESQVTLTFSNEGGSSATYTVSVSGESQWASSDVSPSTLVISAGETDSVDVTITPDSDAEGNYEFSIQILDSDGELVEEIDMEMDVEASNAGVLSDTSNALKLGFIILIVLIIIIGLIVAFRKLGDDDDDDPLEPKDGQTYY